jgi:hypothetical protein
MPPPPNENDCNDSSDSDNDCCVDGIDGRDGRDGRRGPRGHRGHRGPRGPPGPGINAGVSSLTAINGVAVDVPTGNVTITTVPYHYDGHVLMVDQVFGNDVLALTQIYNRPFLTINAALAAAVAGDCVFVNPGIYNEIIVIPKNVALVGRNSEVTTIQALNVVVSTALVTIDLNCRLENITLTLTSNADVDLIGIEFLVNAPTTAKVRNVIVNVTSTNIASATNIIGMRSNSASILTFTPQLGLIDNSLLVVAAGTSVGRGVLINGANRIGMRGCKIQATGTSNNLIGAEITHVNGILFLRGCTLYGELHDLLRSSGTLQITNGSDLFHNDAGTKSFTVGYQTPEKIYGVFGNFSANSVYYLYPGIINIGDVSTITPYKLPFLQNSILITSMIRYTSILVGLEQLIFKVYINANIVPSLTLTLIAGQDTIIDNSTSVTYKIGDTISTSLTTVGAPVAGTFIATLAFY